MAILVLLIDVYSFVLFASVILSWLSLDEDNPLVRGIRTVTEPVLDPIRRVLPPMGGFDLSPMILLLGLRLLRSLLLR